MLILIHTHGQLTVRWRSGLGTELTLRHSNEVQNLTNSDVAIIPLLFCQIFFWRAAPTLRHVTVVINSCIWTQAKTESGPWAAHHTVIVMVNLYC